MAPIAESLTGTLQISRLDRQFSLDLPGKHHRGQPIASKFRQQQALAATARISRKASRLGLSTI